jgi:hypothetical protein
MAYVGSLNIVMNYFILFYVIVEVGNYLKNRIDPIVIVINGD